ncbi:hypothetical protein Daus18300_011983 [Diaporthe australafricana]|uniref:Heterokaryon incompatibility domain-containing protein n=1 Tax=Diaporthe australafricana TaxID=127596 RepID=A0ABR3W4M6_9PEZI
MSTTRSQDVTLPHSILPANSRRNERPRAFSTPSPISIAPKPTGLTYDALKPGEIRLITLEPSESLGAPVRAKLHHRPLESATYEVLPVVERNLKQAGTVYVNNKLVTISGDLLDALRTSRNIHEPRTLWVDPICINHRDSQETLEQGKRMREIYFRAVRVINRQEDEARPKDVVLNKLLTAGEIPSDQIWGPNLLQFGDIESEYAFDTTFRILCEPTPALSPDSGSPQATSADSSPIPTIAESDLQGISVLDGYEDASLWNMKPGATECYKLPDVGGPLAQPDIRLSGKRPFVAAFPEIQHDLQSQKMRQLKSIRRDDKEEASNMVFACPFQKFNPHKYHKCLKYTLSRIKDVKQHIYRQHRQPEYYCARCYETFATTENRDDHARGPQCAKREMPHFEGISEEQKRELQKSSSRKQSLREQWFEIWDVVFPGCPPPRSAVPGNYAEEMIPLLRGVWNEKRTEILSGVLNVASLSSVDTRLLGSIMGSVFDRFEAEVTRSSGGGSNQVQWSPDLSCSSELSQTVSDFTDLDTPGGTQAIDSYFVGDYNLAFFSFEEPVFDSIQRY